MVHKSLTRLVERARGDDEEKDTELEALEEYGVRVCLQGFSVGSGERCMEVRELQVVGG